MTHEASPREREEQVEELEQEAKRREPGLAGEFVQFLAMAKGSAGEVRSQLYVALDQGYIDQEQFDRLSALAIQTARMIGGLMLYLRKSRVKGTKYK